MKREVAKPYEILQVQAIHLALIVARVGRIAIQRDAAAPQEFHTPNHPCSILFIIIINTHTRGFTAATFVPVRSYNSSSLISPDSKSPVLISNY